MQNVTKFLTGSVMFLALTQGALAEVSSLAARFAGGCKADNTTGSCTIKVTANGENLDGESVVLQRSETAKGSYRYVSRTTRSLSESGLASFKFRNQIGCYRVVTSPNGDDTPDVRSRVICEK